MSDATSSSTGDDADLEILGRCLEDLGGAADKSAILADYCARFPHLAEKIRDLARVGQVLGETTSWGVRSPGPQAPESEPLPPRFGPYRVLSKIGRGGMGDVYLAQEDVLNRLVAVKTIRRARATDPALLERFDRERQVLARLHDTHIVPIFATGQEGDLLYFAMPYIRGVALNHVIRTAQEQSHQNGSSSLSSFAALVNEASSRASSTSKGDGEPGPAIVEPPSNGNGNGKLKLPQSYFRSVAATMADAAAALHHAHRAGIIHRDVKPSNIMVEPSGQTWVVDFGLARLKRGETNGDTASEPTDQHPDAEGPEAASHSLTAGTVGTLPYMAPEQIWKVHDQPGSGESDHARDSRIDPRTDVWGLGATLYEFLTLHRAFHSRNEILQSAPTGPRTYAPNLSRDLEAVCLKALTKGPEHRYPSAEALADDLRRWTRFEPVKARPARTIRRLLLWSRRNRGWATAIVMLALSMLMVAIGSVALSEGRARAAKAETRAVQLQSEAAAERARTLQLLSVQIIERIRLSTHLSGWRKSIEKQISEAAGAATESDRGFLRSQAIASLRELDAVEEKELQYAASNLAFEPQGRRLFSCWERDQVIRVWHRETDKQQTLKIKGDGPFAFRADGTPLQFAKVVKDDRTLILQNLDHETVVRRLESPDKYRPFLSTGVITRNGAYVAALCRSSNDDPELSTAHSDPPGVVAVWEADWGKLVCTIALPTPAFVLALSPDGKLLAAGDVHGTVSIWTLPVGKPFATLSAGDNRIQCLTFGREPRRSYRHVTDATIWQLAVGDVGGTVIMLDLIGKRIRNFGRGSSNDIKALDFSPDGSMVGSAGRGLARVWAVATGRLVVAIDAGNYMPALAFSPVGDRIAIGRWGIFNTKDGVKIFELREGPGMRTLQGMAAKIEKKAFSPDGRLIAALADDWQVGVWETATGRLRYLFGIPPGVFSDNTGIAFDSSSRRLAISAYEHATLWDTEGGHLLRSWTLPPGLDAGIAFHGPDRLMLFRTETRDGVPPFSSNPADRHPRVYRLYNLLNAAPVTPVAEPGDHDAHCFGVVMPIDGRFIVADGINRKEGRTFIAYDMVSGKALWSMPAPRSSEVECSVLVDPTGSMMALNFYRDHRGTWLSLPDRKWIADVDATALLLGPNGDRYFSVHQDRRIAQNEFHYHPQGRAGPEIPFLQDRETDGAFLFAPDGSHIAWAAGDHSLTICDLVEVQRAMAAYGLGW
jgi:serine/threonine protein kinase/WD40 repeat protein